MTIEITKLVTLILGISISGERLVTLIKTVFPSLAAPSASAGDQPADSGKEISKKVILMIIAFLCCFLTAYIIYLNQDKHEGSKIENIPLWLLALLASGGSAFWTNILGYVSSLKDLNTQKALTAKLNFRAQLNANPAVGHEFGNRKLEPQASVRRFAALKTVRFTTSFSGGLGTLKIKISGQPDLDFTKNETKTINLAPGNYLYSAAGAAATGDGAGCILTIDGDVIADSPQTYGAGPILPNIHPLIVTD